MPGLLESFILTALTSAGLGGAALSVAVTALTGIVGIGLSVGLNFLASSLFKPSAPKPEDVQQSLRQPTPPRYRHYGRVKISGAWAFGESSQGNFHKVLALGQGPFEAIEEFWVDDNHVTVEPDFGVDDDPYNGKVRIEHRLGTPGQTHYANLTAIYPSWTSAHVGKGVASLFITQRATASKNYLEKFPNGINTSYRVVARTSLIYDVRNGVTAWKDNAALIIRDYIVHPDGMRFPPDLINTPLALAGWQAMANRADEAINLKAGGTEPRYRLWGSYKLEERPADVIGRMLACCDGRLAPTPDGGLTVDIGSWEEPTVVIDDSIITGFTDLSRGKDILTTANTVRAQYLDPNQDYQAADADPWVDAEDVSFRGELATDISLVLAPSHSQARRLMKIAAYRSNPEWIGQFTCNLKALAAFGKRLVRIRYPLFNIDAVFEVQDFRFIMGEGGILQGVSIFVQTFPENVYEWNAEQEEGDAPVSEESEGNNEIPLPTDFDVTIQRKTISGQLVPYARLTFDLPPSEALKIQAQGKLSSDTDWTTIAVADETPSADSFILSDGSTYDFRIRHVTIATREGGWTTPITITAVADTSAPGVVTSAAAIGGAGSASLSWVAPNSANYYAANIYRNTTNNLGTATLVRTEFGGPSSADSWINTGLAPGTYFYWIRSRNPSGIEAAAVATGSVTVT